MLRWIIYGTAGVLLYGYANRAFYVPSREKPSPPIDPRLNVESVRIPNGPAELSAWILEPIDSQPKATVVFVHGNAGNLENHVPFVDFLPREGFRVLIFDYQGYGDSTAASPSRQSTYSDVLAAIDYSSDRWGKVWLMGHSLGASLAIVAAKERKQVLHGLVAVAPFTSYRAMARSALGGNPVTYTLFWPLGFFLRKGLDPVDAIASIAPLPLLLIHGEEDEIVPSWMSRELYLRAGHPKEFVSVPGMTHNDVLEFAGREYSERVTQFLSKGGQ